MTKPGQNTHRGKVIKKDFPEILRKHMGLVTYACKEAGISTHTYYDWRRDDQEFADACDEAYKHVDDFVESKLYSLISEKNPATVIFYCKTKLRNKGYVERIETTGKDGGPIEVQKFKAADTDKEILKSYEEEVIEKAKNELMKGQTNQ